MVKISLQVWKDTNLVWKDLEQLVETLNPYRFVKAFPLVVTDQLIVNCLLICSVIHP